MTVVVDNENVNDPVFNLSSYEGYIWENSPIGTEVSMKKQISTSHGDHGNNSSLVLTLHGDDSNSFEINQDTRNIFYRGGQNILDREKKPAYSLRIVAKDRGK